MLVLLPVALLLLASLTVLVLRREYPRLGIIWLFSVFAAFVAWVILLVFHWRMPAPLVISNWGLIEGLTTNITFQIDSISWPYAFALASLGLAVALTSAVRLQMDSAAQPWAADLAISGAGLLAVMAGTPLTLLIGWVVIDLIELAVMLSNAIDDRQSQQSTVAFSVRLVGIFILIWAIVASRSTNQLLDFGSVTPEAGFYILIAAGLRLGVIPLHLPYTHEIPIRRGVGTILRLVTLATSISVLGRLPEAAVPSDWVPYLTVFAALAALYGGAMWLAAEDELNGRPYWLIAVAGIVITCIIRGHPESTPVWGVTFILAGGVIFLYSDHTKYTQVIPVFAALGFAGVPFTPAANGWPGLISAPFNPLDILFLVSHILLFLGYLRHSLIPTTSSFKLERWVQLVYPLGLFFLVLSQWLAGFFTGAQFIAVNLWWAGLVSLVITSAGLAWFIYAWRTQKISASNQSEWITILAGRIGTALAAFFRLDWLYRFFGWLFRLVQQLVRGLTVIMEGDGGILWALLMLTLLISILRFGGSP
jgi:hypothetical protein